MAVRQDKVQVDVEINGKGAGQTLEQLEKESKQLVRELRKMDPATEEFAKKAEKLKGVKEQTGNIKKEMFGVGQATGQAKQSFEAMNPYQQKFAQLGSIIGMVKGKVLTVVDSMKTLRGAIMTTGVGALVVLLGSLVSYLTSTQEGMDKVTGVTRPLMAIFERLKGVVQELGGKVFKTLSDSISNPKQALSELADIIQNNVIKRFEAFGVMGKAIVKIFSKDWKEGFAELGNGYLQAVTGVEDVADKVKNAMKGASDWVKEGIDLGAQLDQMQKQIEKTEIELIKNRARLNEEYATAKEIAQDQSKTEEERLAAARAAQAAQNDLLKQEQDFLDLKIKKLDLEHSQNDTSREDQKAMSELIAERTQLEADAAKKRASAKSLENTVLKEGAVEHQKNLDAKLKAEEEYAKKVAAANEALIDFKIATMTDETERAIAEINRRFEKETAAFEGNEQQKLEFEKLKEQERAAALLEVKKEAKINEFNELLTLEDELAEERRMDIEEKVINAAITEEEARQAQLDVERAHMEAKLALIGEQHGKESLEYRRQNMAINKFDKDRADEQIATEKRISDAKFELQQASLGQFGDMISQTIDILGKDEASRKKHANVIKALETAKITTNAISEVSNIWRNAQSSPLAMALGPIAGNVIAAVQTGFAIARAGIALQKVSSTKFALGDIVRGPSHGQGGISMFNRQTGQEIGEMEGDEIILTKGVSRDPLLRAAASRINVLGGGRMFEAGGPLNPYRDSPERLGTAQDAAIQGGSQNIPISANQANAAQLSQSAVVAELRALRADINNMNTRLKAYVVYSELEDAGAEVDQVREDATLRA